MYVN
ncbi:hypothetical protein CGLO_00667 [Colletotrichum gloeosporioides Cg-14]